MKNVCVCFFATTFALLSCLHAAAVGPDLAIALYFDTFSFQDYDGALILPGQGNNPGQAIRSKVASASTDGKVKAGPGLVQGSRYSWLAQEVGAGPWDFYVSAVDTPAGFEWGDDVQVSLAFKGKTTLLKPPPGKGSIWHVCTVFADGIDLINVILPVPRLIRGYATDAVTGKPVPDADVKLISRVGNARVGEVLTDDKGRYAFIAPDGFQFEVTIAAKGYTSFSERVFFGLEDYPRRVDAYLSPIMKKAQYRFVLSWGQRPADLDAHLTGPDEGGSGTFHISFRNTHSYLSRHFLDRDSTQGYGPETITLTRLDDGDYDFFVHDWTNQANRQSSRLSSSGATVRLYRESELLQTFLMPENAVGTVWNVCVLDGRTGEIRVLNEMSSP